jgi:hypothetical protein
MSELSEIVANSNNMSIENLHIDYDDNAKDVFQFNQKLDNRVDEEMPFDKVPV